MGGTHPVSPERFVLRVQADGAVLIEVGHAFCAADIPALVAAQHAVAAKYPAQRTPLEAVRPAG